MYYVVENHVGGGYFAAKCDEYTEEELQETCEDCGDSDSIIGTIEHKNELGEFVKQYEKEHYGQQSI